MSSGSSEAAASLALPAIQAAATILIIEKQKDLHDDIANKRIGLIDAAVSKYCAAIEACRSSNLFSEAFGSVPDAAIYKPVDPLETQYQTINANLQNVPAADRLMTAINRLNENNDLARAAVFDPAFHENMHRGSIQIKDLMEGRIPVDDVTNILTDTAEQAALNGRIGNTCKMTFRDLGVSRLNAQATGRRERAQQLQVAQLASPVERQFSIQNMMNTVESRIALALTTTQLVQNSLQNANNLAAAGDPTALASIQTKLNKIGMVLGQEAQRGNLVNAFVPDFASLLQPVISSISGALHGGKVPTKNTDREGTAPTTTNSNTNGERFREIIVEK
jgi:hypothetical protein|tara:strand:- start:821 stop:1825 length:1005 start_codon:yes stop_codon:yes gene_type:complete